MENLHLNIETAGNEVIIREGTASKIKETRGWERETSIDSVMEFYSIRKTSITPANSIVVIDNTKATVLLIVEDTTPDNTIAVNGVLKADSDYAELGINSEKYYDEKTLEVTLRKKPHLFVTTDAYRKFLSGLRNFTAKVKLDYEAKNDRQGKKSVSISSDANTTMEKTVQLKLRPWNTGERNLTDVNIYVDFQDSRPAFYLESDALIVEAERLKDEVIEKAVEHFSELPILRS